MSVHETAPAPLERPGARRTQTPTESEVRMTDDTPTRDEGDEHPQGEVFDLETRRNFLTLLAMGEFDSLDAIAEDIGVNWRDLALQEIAIEVIRSSAALETDPAINGEGLRVIGAMVNGLFGSKMADDADELLVSLNAAGARMRKHIGLGPLPPVAAHA